MTKLVCYGVRLTEVPFFHEINKKFGTNIEVSYYDGEPTTEEVKEMIEEVDLNETESL